MSHIAMCQLQVKDLAALKQAADFLGFDFIENQKTHAWYGVFLNDWRDDRAAVRQGRDPKTFGKCDHALRSKTFQSKDYEIGVVKNEDGTYALVYDSYGPGHKLEAMAGIDLVKLKMEYGAVVAHNDLKKRLGGQGWYVQTTRDSLSNPKVMAVKQ